MKQTIEGFSQEYAMTLKKTVATNEGEKTVKIDCTDLVILRWFTDFYPNMRKTTIDGRECVMVEHSKLLEDLPMIDISKRAFIDRMQKLVDFGILDYQLVKRGGTFSFYTFGKNYEPLCGQRTAEKDLVITATDKIVGYLNKKAHTNFKTNNKLTRRYIFERLAEGYAMQDFKTVIDTKYDDWAETEFEKYLRPSTLFGDRFEDYLNEAKYKKNYCDSEGTK